jgi:hypothetical protein
MRSAFKIPNSLFFFIGLGFIALSYIWHTGTIDIHVHDTMIVITSGLFYRGVAAILLFFWISYSVAQVLIFSRWLVWLHLFLCVIAMAIFTILTAGPSVYSRPGSPFMSYKMAYKLATTFNVVLVSGQLVFLLNMIAGTIKKLVNLASSRK